MREKFIRARAELYGHLYKRYLADDGPFCGREELDGLCETNALISRAVSFAIDMGHVRQNRFGGIRLAGQGILYAEKELFGE